MDGGKRGLPIGGFKSVWLADLVAAYLLNQTIESLLELIYHGIYRNDGFIVFQGIKTKREINEWLERFQNEVDILQNQTSYNLLRNFGILKKT